VSWDFISLSNGGLGIRAQSIGGGGGNGGAGAGGPTGLFMLGRGGSGGGQGGDVTVAKSGRIETMGADGIGVRPWGWTDRVGWN
jgi:hypothetical protein